MPRVIGTTQLFTLGPTTEGMPGPKWAEAAAVLCRFLAGQTEGIYQIDSRGFFDADGNLLVAEDS
jgi:hypothetical protein